MKDLYTYIHEVRLSDLRGRLDKLKYMQGRVTIYGKRLINDTREEVREMSRYILDNGCDYEIEVYDQDLNTIIGRVMVYAETNRIFDLEAQSADGKALDWKEISPAGSVDVMCKHLTFSIVRVFNAAH